MTSTTIMIAYALFVSIATLCKPDFLGTNKFLEDFAGTELLGLLAVILAITFASVANIHLALNQIVARVYGRNVQDGQAKVSGVRREINSNAWLLFYAFIFCALALLARDAVRDNGYLHSIANGVGLGALLLNILVFRDIYCTVFELAASDLAVKGAPPPDYSVDTPSAGSSGEAAS